MQREQSQWNHATNAAASIAQMLLLPLLEPTVVLLSTPSPQVCQERL
jgi:hypothetical protein